MKIIKAAAILCALMLLTSCKSTYVTNEFYALDTIVTIKARVSALELEVLEDKIYDLERELSSKIPYSKVSKFNRAPSEMYEDADLSELLNISRLIGMLTQGAFDVTLAPVINLWDFKAKNPTVPEMADIKKALEHVDYTKIEKLEPPQCRLSDPEAAIDLSGVAKGYITDKAVEFLIDQNINSALLNFGGNVFAVGEKERGAPWTVGIKNPMGDGVIAEVQVFNRAVVTSGNYERYFDIDGVRFHHILDPKTGFPVQNELASVTIIADNATLADALSTACYVMGAKKSIALLDELDNAVGIFVLNDGSLLFSKGASDYLVK